MKVKSWLLKVQLALVKAASYNRARHSLERGGDGSKHWELCCSNGKCSQLTSNTLLTLWHVHLGFVHTCETVKYHVFLKQSFVYISVNIPFTKWMLDIVGIVVSQ